MLALTRLSAPVVGLWPRPVDGFGKRRRKRPSAAGALERSEPNATRSWLGNGAASD